MVQRDVVAAKVGRARAWLRDAAVPLLGAQEAYLADAQRRDLALFYLFLAIQECIDLAAHWVADAAWSEPDDAASAFDVLAERGVIDSAARRRRYARLRACAIGSRMATPCSTTRGSIARRRMASRRSAPSWPPSRRLTEIRPRDVRPPSPSTRFGYNPRTLSRRVRRPGPGGFPGRSDRRRPASPPTPPRDAVTSDTSRGAAMTLTPGTRLGPSEIQAATGETA